MTGGTLNSTMEMSQGNSVRQENIQIMNSGCMNVILLSIMVKYTQ